MHILLVNAVSLNGGDAAITEATVRLLREEFGSDTTFVVHEYQPRAASRHYPAFTFRRWAYHVVARSLYVRGPRQRLIRALKLARFRLACEAWTRGLGRVAGLALKPAERRIIQDFVDADLVVTVGGTYLVEHYDFTPRLLALEAALRLRRPLVFFTQSLGPFTRPHWRSQVARAVNGAALVLLRDERSRDHLRALGVRDDHLHVTADVVFAIADEHALREARVRGAFPPPGPDGAPPRVAVSVREWAHFKTMSPEAGMAAYKESIRAVVVYLVERYGARVTFVSTCQGIPEYWTDDSRVATTIVEELPPHVRGSVEVDRGFRTPDALVAHLRGFDLVVSTRMHMAILALGAGTLVFPIAYEFKTRELFDRLGLGEYVHDMEGVRADALVRSLEAFLDDAARVRDVMFTGVERERRRAVESGAMVRAAVDGDLARASAPR